MRSGQVVGSYRRSFVVVFGDGARLSCPTKGRKLDVACGDFVAVELKTPEHGVIVAIEARRSLLYRSDRYRQKMLAANATQIMAVIAPQPPFNDALLTRCLVAAESAGLKSVIVCNKADLAAHADAWRMLGTYRDLGYCCIALHARADCAVLLPALRGQTTVLVGQSGMGKSTIINTLLPGSRAATREVSVALNSGRHTTTAAALYRLDADSALIDTPGLQVFGLAHLSAGQLQQAFPEFREHADACRFSRCAHSTEPGCALRAAVEDGRAAARRLDLLRALTAENQQHKPWQ